MTASTHPALRTLTAARNGAMATLLRGFVNTPPAGAARPATPAGHPGRAAKREFDDAFALFELGRWPQAFELLGALADRGHPQAARLALLMARRGSALFGGHYGASAEQRRRWSQASD